ncbi:MAG: CBS domain-containing protein [Spirochaetales bacterium]|nr:CBS domain-containing protein [Spirochaetales bacterium]
MKLSSLIEKDFILVNQNVTTREEAIEVSLNALFDKKRLSIDKKRLISEINQRDELGGTVFPTGLAIPHARVKDYGDLSIMICIPEKPIVINDIEVRCFVIMLTSTAVSNLYLQVLASFTKLSMDEEYFSRLIAAKNAELISKQLAEIYVKKDLTVEDLMSTDFGTVSPESNLKELTDLFYLKKTSYLPVIDSDNRFIGEVRINDLISIGIPNYAVMIGNLSFLNSFEPFEKLMLEEENILVSDIMKKSQVSLRPEASVVEAALELTQGNYRHLPVVKDGNLVGILNIMDILVKVLRR